MGVPNKGFWKGFIVGALISMLLTATTAYAISKVIEIVDADGSALGTAENPLIIQF